MSFQSPLLLLALLVVPLAAIAYRAHARRAERAVSAFAPAPVLPSVAPRRPGWRRHAPYALYALALAGLALAAGPAGDHGRGPGRARVGRPRDGHLGLDAGARTSRPPGSWPRARPACDFLDDVPREVRVGAVVFNHAMRSMEPPSRDRAEVRERSSGSLRSSGGTATGEALAGALGLVEASDGGARRRRPRSCCSPTARRPTAASRCRWRDEAARREDPDLHRGARHRQPARSRSRRPTGTRRARCPAGPRDAAAGSRPRPAGRYFEADDSPELSEVYERLGSQVGKRDEQRERDAPPSRRRSALLLLAGGALSLHWFRRLP